MIGKLAGVALDARVAARLGDTRSRALAAQWIAKNALAVRGVKVELVGDQIEESMRFDVSDVDDGALARGSSPRLPVDDFAASMGEIDRAARLAEEADVAHAPVGDIHHDFAHDLGALAVRGEAPTGLLAARWLGIRAETLSGLLAGLAAVPALVDTTTIPRRWRLALRALGVPMLDRPLADMPVRPAGPITLAARPWLPGDACAMYVDAIPTGYRVRAG